MSVDTALFVMTAGETKEDSTLVCFTESKDKEVCYEFGGCIHIMKQLFIIFVSNIHNK